MPRWLKARWLKALSLALAVAILSIFTASCSSSGEAQIRFVHAIQDAGTLNVDVYGSNNSAGTQEFTDISFLGVQPTQPAYTTLPAGTNAIEGFSTTPGDIGFGKTNVSWLGSTEYTVVATGFNTDNGNNVVILSIPDNNAKPAANEIEFRVIHASPSGPGTVNVYIEPNPATAPTGNPTISGLVYTQSSAYISLPYNTGSFPGYTVYVTTTAGTVIFSETINPSDGAIRTLVLTDVQGGNSMRQAFLELPDLN